ncbi:MAG: hypothetical protein NZ914_09935 [Gemmatales bacterium]|nr:hypothetical protein [Gemmatales bacterium]
MQDLEDRHHDRISTTPAKQGRCLRLGILGLGANWQVWRRVLRRSRSWRVEVVYDAVQQTAWREATRLGCQAAESVWQLIAWPGLDGILYCDVQWFGLWPLEVARIHQARSTSASHPSMNVATSCGDSKPPRWWCLVPPTVELSRATQVLEQIIGSDLQVHFVWPEWEIVMGRIRSHQVRQRLGTTRWMEVQVITTLQNASAQGLVGQSVQVRAYHAWCGALLCLSHLTGELAEEVHGLGKLQDEYVEYHTLAARFPTAGWACIETVIFTDNTASHFAAETRREHLTTFLARPCQLRILGTAGQLSYCGPDWLDWYLRRWHVREHWKLPRSLEEYLLQRWRRQWLSRESTSETNRHLQHYCALLQSLR